MKISKNDLLMDAKEKGYRPEILEKVILLLKLLDQFASLPFLKNKIVLKGGTALNLFYFDYLPRLSVDIDLNYIGTLDRYLMLQEKPLIDEAITAICRQNQFEIYRHPQEHAGGKIVLRYQSALGHIGNLEIDMNYLYRIPLYDVVPKDSHPWPILVKNIPLLDIHELASGKLHALFSRTASRDLFDIHRLLHKSALDQNKLRTAFVVYMGMHQGDWKNISVHSITLDVDDLKNRLIPVLQKSEISGTTKLTIKKWAEKLIDECREALKIVLPFTESERAFLTKLQDYGEIDPALICTDNKLMAKIQSHPALHWKIKRNLKMQVPSLV